MELFLGMPDVSAWTFLLLCLSSFVTAIIAIVFGAGGGIMLLIFMAFFFPPAVLVPMHTLVQLGIVGGRTAMMHRYVLRPSLLPFAIGAALGAFLGGQLFVSLPAAPLQTLIGSLIICVIWLPQYGKVGNIRGRFAVIGFIATFIGMFVSATASFIAPFVASSAEDRRTHVATLAGLTTLTHVLKLVSFSVLGISIISFWPLVLMMIVCGILGNYIGRLLLDKMSERRFRIIFKIFMTILALRLILNTVFSF